MIYGAWYMSDLYGMVSDILCIYVWTMIYVIFLYGSILLILSICKKLYIYISYTIDHFGSCNHSLILHSRNWTPWTKFISWGFWAYWKGWGWTMKWIVFFIGTTSCTTPPAGWVWARVLSLCSIWKSAPCQRWALVQMRTSWRCRGCPDCICLHWECHSWDFQAL